jgi:hypothetical protein
MPDWRLSLEHTDSWWLRVMSPDGKEFATQHKGTLDSHGMAELLRAVANQVLELTTHVAKGPLGTDDPPEAA